MQASEQLAARQRPYRTNEHRLLRCDKCLGMQIDITLLHQGGSLEEPPADENHFELVLKKHKGLAVGPFGVLQIPISFKAVSLEESNGEVQVVMEAAPTSNLNQPQSEPLLWQYPIKVSACAHCGSCGTISALCVLILLTASTLTAVLVTEAAPHLQPQPAPVRSPAVAIPHQAQYLSLLHHLCS